MSSEKGPKYIYAQEHQLYYYNYYYNFERLWENYKNCKEMTAQ